MSGMDNGSLDILGPLKMVEHTPHTIGSNSKPPNHLDRVFLLIVVSVLRRPVDKHSNLLPSHNESKTSKNGEHVLRVENCPSLTTTVPVNNSNSDVTLVFLNKSRSGKGEMFAATAYIDRIHMDMDKHSGTKGGKVGLSYGYTDVGLPAHDVHGACRLTDPGS